jgi:hypothetical protein
MKKILLSMGSILFASALLAGGTGAFFSSGNSSTGNTFATGVVDLQFDNESYVTDNFGHLIFSTTTSWGLGSLTGKYFFKFFDLKPGDVGEDTISLHANDNNAWACMNIKLTGTPEFGISEPESLVDFSVGSTSGELQNYLYFTFWADDGDNVYEQGETVFKTGLVKDLFDGKNWSLADSQTNIWGNNPKYIPGGSTKYIGKEWCFGTSTPNPISQDGKGKTGSNGPLVRGTGFVCDGIPVGNIAQSDGISVDVNFSASQARDNNSFVCGDPGTTTPKGSISGKKWNDADKDGWKGQNESYLSNWTIGISSGGATTTTTTNGSGAYTFDNLAAGNYLICEVQQVGWKQTFPEQICWKTMLGSGQNVTGKDFGNYMKSKYETPQYCSHGYWKQSQHFDNWVNYSPSQKFSSVFDNAFGNLTLLEVLQQGGGGLNRLGRETVGALLNAGKLNVFPYSQAQVISMFNSTYPGTSSQYETLADKFELDENCPLN